MLKAALIQILSTAYVGLISFVLTIFLARVFGPVDFGRYQFALTVGSLFALLQDGGFRSLLFRETAACSPGIDLNRLYAVAFFHLLFVTALGIFFSLLGGSFLLALALVFFGLLVGSQWLSAYFKGRGSFYLEALWNSLFRTSTALVIYFCAQKASFSPKTAFEAAIAGALLAYLFLPFYKIPFEPLLKYFSFKAFFFLYKLTLSFLLIDLFTQIYFRADIIMLKMLANYKAAGLYAAAYRLLEGVILAFTPIIYILAQRLRQKWTQIEAFKLLFLKALICILLVASMLSFLGYWGRDLILVLYGKNFKGTPEIFVWLLGALFFVLPNYLLTQTAIVLNQERFYAINCAILALVNISLNLWFIPRFGAKGAAMTTLITEALLALTLGYAIRGWLFHEKGDT